MPNHPTEQPESGQSLEDWKDEFDGYIPPHDDRDNAGTPDRHTAWFLTRFEPRVVVRTADGVWESTQRAYAPGEISPHGERILLLQDHWKAKEMEEQKR